MMKRKMRGLALVLTVLLAFQSFGFVAFAATDLKGHWSEVKMNDWINKGFIKGYPDGTVKPNNKITRAEFMAIVNKAFEYSGGYSASFSDVNKTDWYYSVIAIAIANGYIGGYPDGKMKPKAPISRAEAAAIIAKVANLTADYSTASYYNDKASIPSWALGAVGAVTKAGIMSGYNGGIFGPNRPITRAETVMALSKALALRAVGSQVYDVPGTYGSNSASQLIKGDVLIKSANVNLKNMVVTGSLVIDKAVGSGNVTLTNVTVQGQIYVYGGGVNSIIFDSVIAPSVYVARKDATVRVVATGYSKIDTVYVQGNAKVEEASVSGGGFGSLRVDTDAVTGIVLDLTGVKLDTMDLKAKGTVINADSKSAITKVTVSGTTNVINTVSGTSIGTFVANQSVVVKGSGSITTADINANGVSFDVRPGTLNVKSGVSQPTIVGGSIESWTPSTGATGIAVTADIVIKFKEKVRLVSGDTDLTNTNVDSNSSTDSKNLIAIRLKNSSGTKIDFNASVSTVSGKTVLTVDPSGSLAYNQLYYIEVNRDLLENYDDDSLTGTFNSTFTTIADGAPTVSSFSPVSGGTNVAVGSDIVWTMSEKVRLKSGDTDLTNSNVDDQFILMRTSSTGADVANVAFDATVATVSNKTVITINPTGDLLNNTSYYVAIKTDTDRFEDYTDVVLTGTKKSSFTTILTNSAPLVEAYVPTSGAAAVSVDGNLVLTFNKEVRYIDDTVLTNTNVKAKIKLSETNSSGAEPAYAATVSTVNGKTVVTIDPTASLKSNQLYYLAIDGLEDYIGQVLGGTKSITFTTASTGAPTIESVTPTINAALDSNVVITFSKEVRATDDTVLTSGNVVAKANLVLRKATSGGADVAFVPTLAVTGNKTVITLNPTVDFESGTTYYVAVSGLEDTIGQALIGASSFNLTTIPVVPTSVTITGAGSAVTIITAGGTLQMTETVLPSNATDKSVTWSVVPGTGTASISNTGLLTAISNGTVTVRATSNANGALVGQLVVTLSNQAILPTSVTVTGAGSAVTISSPGGTLQMSAGVLPVDATTQSVTWSVVSGTGSATISNTGLLTAVTNGTVTVRATSNASNALFGQLEITISNQPILPTSIAVTAGAATITVDNGTLQFAASVLPANAANQTVTWSISSGSSRASIDSNGLLTAIDNGTVVVRATSNANAVNGEMTITISNQIIPVTGVSVSGGSPLSGAGATVQLFATITPSGATNTAVTWTVNSGIGATVDTNGLVTATGNGQVVIRATSNDTGVFGETTIDISGF